MKVIFRHFDATLLHIVGTLPHLGVSLESLGVIPKLLYGTLGLVSRDFVLTWSHFGVTAVTLAWLYSYFDAFCGDFDVTWGCLGVTLASLWANEGDIRARLVAISCHWDYLGPLWWCLGAIFGI